MIYVKKVAKYKHEDIIFLFSNAISQSTIKRLYFLTLNNDEAVRNQRKIKFRNFFCLMDFNFIALFDLSKRSNFDFIYLFSKSKSQP